MSEQWIPEVGRLTARQMLDGYTNNLSLEFRDEPGDEWHYRSIARLDDFVSGPRFGGSVECMREAVGLSGAGTMIVRRYARDSDLRAIIRLWKSNLSIEEWLEELKHLALLPKEIERIYWTQFHTPEKAATAMAIEAGLLSAQGERAKTMSELPPPHYARTGADERKVGKAVSWHSNLPHGTTEAHIDALCESDEDREWREYLEREFGDVMVYALSFAERAGLDVANCVRKALAKAARKYPADKCRGRNEKSTL